MPSPITLIVGLGNPGDDYAATRHNAGFWFVDKVAEKFNSKFSSETKFFSEITRFKSQEIDCRIVKPVTYMNESGRAVQAVINFYKYSPDEVLVVHDDIDLVPGTIRLKYAGGHGGHNGLRDIMEKIGSNDFWRLRIGVGHPGHRDLVVNSVLSKASIEEQDLINEATDHALTYIPLILSGEARKAMNELNKSNQSRAASKEQNNSDSDEN